ncbi:MAG: V-type ATP synthase subunit K [Spirochaetales bacterium]|nr:V-type ATP synthase subunit K [Spirochaetales bacterium]
MNIGEMAFSAALAFSAIGSGFGIGMAGMASVGAWKKCYAMNKSAPFLLLAFIGAPLTQTIYGYILMIQIKGVMAAAAPGLAILGIGAFGGVSIGVSAFFQGKIGAAAADAFAETGKGFANYLIAIGIVETTAIFTLVFMLSVMG